MPAPISQCWVLKSRMPAKIVLIPAGYPHVIPAIAQLVEHWTVDCAEIRWSLRSMAGLFCHTSSLVCLVGRPGHWKVWAVWLRQPVFAEVLLLKKCSKSSRRHLSQCWVPSSSPGSLQKLILVGDPHVIPVWPSSFRIWPGRAAD